MPDPDSAAEKIHQHPFVPGAGYGRMLAMLIRREAPADIPAVRKHVEDAFRRPAEARLVDQLRADGDAIIAAAAVDHEAVVGHVMLSKMTAPFRGWGLSSCGAAGAAAEKGLGTSWPAGGWSKSSELDRRASSFSDPRLYRRFGFDPALANGFTSHYAGPHLMALALGESLPAITDRIDYAPAFAALG